VLLPLRVRDRDETLHEDVRAAAIPKSLVGNFLPQEEFHRQRILFPVIEPRIQKDESQGTGKPVRTSHNRFPFDSSFISSFGAQYCFHPSNLVEI
jgi:hypothetical protein